MPKIGSGTPPGLVTATSVPVVVSRRTGANLKMLAAYPEVMPFGMRIARGVPRLSLMGCAPYGVAVWAMSGLHRG